MFKRLLLLLTITLVAIPMTGSAGTLTRLWDDLISDNKVIFALHLNDEFDQIVEALNGTSNDKQIIMKYNHATDSALIVDQLSSGIITEFRVDGVAKARFNSAGQLVSFLTTGTAPFQVSSTTKVTNLNCDLLDGFTSADFLGGVSNALLNNVGNQTLAASEVSNPLLTFNQTGAGQIVRFSQGGVSKLTINNTGQISSAVTGMPPILLNSTVVNTNLNADLIDGFSAGNSSGQVPVSNGTVNTDLNSDELDGLDSTQFVRTDVSGQNVTEDFTIQSDTNPSVLHFGDPTGIPETQFSITYDDPNVTLAASAVPTNLVVEVRPAFSPDATSIADNGGGTPATHTLSPSLGFVRLSCNDANGCTITMGETGMVDGQVVYITNATTNVCNFADTAGVTELAGAFAMGQYDSLTLIYSSDRWVEISRSNN